MTKQGLYGFGAVVSLGERVEERGWHSASAGFGARGCVLPRVDESLYASVRRRRLCRGNWKSLWVCFFFIFTIEHVWDSLRRESEGSSPP